MLQLFVNYHLVAEQIAMPATENVELVTFADQLDADSQMRIGNLRSIFPDWAAIAEAVMHVLRDGVDVPSAFAVRISSR